MVFDFQQRLVIIWIIGVGYGNIHRRPSFIQDLRRAHYRWHHNLDLIYLILLDLRIPFLFIICLLCLICIAFPVFPVFPVFPGRRSVSTMPLTMFSRVCLFVVIKRKRYAITRTGATVDYVNPSFTISFEPLSTPEIRGVSWSTLPVPRSPINRFDRKYPGEGVGMQRRSKRR